MCVRYILVAIVILKAFWNRHLWFWAKVNLHDLIEIFYNSCQVLTCMHQAVRAIHTALSQRSTDIPAFSYWARPHFIKTLCSVLPVFLPYLYVYINWFINKQTLRKKGHYVKKGNFALYCCHGNSNNLL